jgi:PAS domain S-box-containing protein
MFNFGKNKQLSDISRNIVENFEDGIVAIDSHHNIVLFNEGAQKVFGYAPDEVIGQHLNILLPDRFHLQHDLMIEEFGTGTKLIKPSSQRTRQTFGRRKDGSEFVASISIIKTGSGIAQSYAAVVRDISENKKTEDELLRLAATDPLTGAFNRREFTALADQESQRANRYNHPLSMMMLDLDHFKKLNDSYGQAAGDKALHLFYTLF